MGLRKHRQARVDWQEWVREHREELSRSGIDEAILESSHRWHVFLEHGWDQWTGWLPDYLDGDGAQVLYEFLLREYGHERDWFSSIFCRLERKLDLSPSRVMINRLTEVAVEIEAAWPGVVTELEPFEQSVRLWLYREDRTFVLEGLLGGGFDVREIPHTDGFRADDHHAVRLHEATRHVLALLGVPNEQTAGP